MTLEIIIPLRNPTEVLDRSIESLIAQTDRNFSVLISDNHSTRGQEHIARALDRLAQGGLPVRKIKPPMKLEHVEHWNWAHYRSSGDWLKPMCAGDWLESEYVARIRKTISDHPSCRYVHAPSFSPDMNAPLVPPLCGWEGRFRPPREMQGLLVNDEAELGPAVCAAYDRTAFFALGGHSINLSPSGDLFFFHMLAANFGVFGLAAPLVHFQSKTNHASSCFPESKNDSLDGLITSHFAFAYYVWTEGHQLSVPDYLRLLTGAFALRK
jgi:glycosyltransferase involved in cell wall biosynthesis